MPVTKRQDNILHFVTFISFMEIHPKVGLIIASLISYMMQLAGLKMVGVARNILVLAPFWNWCYYPHTDILVVCGNRNFA